MNEAYAFASKGGKRLRCNNWLIQLSTSWSTRHCYKDIQTNYDVVCTLQNGRLPYAVLILILVLTLQSLVRLPPQQLQTRLGRPHKARAYPALIAHVCNIAVKGLSHHGELAPCSVQCSK